MACLGVYPVRASNLFCVSARNACAVQDIPVLPYGMHGLAPINRETLASPLASRFDQSPS